MRFSVLFLLLTVNYHGVSAAPARVWWPQWTISSSEELSQGIKYSRNSYAPSYPLTRIFDNDAATAWVFSSTTKAWDTAAFRDRHGIELKPNTPLVIDGLRLMNGHNASRERFLRNDRALQIRVTLDTGQQKIARLFSLSDDMGWHKISWPRQTVKTLKIEFTRLTRGIGPSNDVCIAGLELLQNGRKIAMKMPHAVMFYDGLEGCNASFLILKNGQIVDAVAASDGYVEIWSSDGRYVSGFGGLTGDKYYLWIADARQGKIVRKIFHPGLDYSWLNAHTLRATSADKARPLKQTIVLPH